MPAPFDWDSVPERVPRTSGIHWLERDPGVERALKWSVRLLYVLLPLPAFGAIALFLAIYTEVGPDAGADVQAKLNEVGIVLLLLTVTLALLVPLIRYSARAFRTRLGTDGKRLYIRRDDGRQLTVEPARLAYTDRVILYREYSLPLRGGQQKPLYSPGEVETWLGPLLRQARKLTPAEALRHQWKNGTRTWIWWLAGAVLLGIMLALMAMIQ
jgi:hypothetical protein